MKNRVCSKLQTGRCFFSLGEILLIMSMKMVSYCKLREISLKQPSTRSNVRGAFKHIYVRGRGGEFTWGGNIQSFHREGGI